MPVTPRLLTVAQVAEALAMKDRTIRAWIAAGRLPVIRIGVSVRVPAEAVERLIGQPRAPLDESGQ